MPERAERAEHDERSTGMSQDLDALAGHYLARVMERQSNYFDMFLKEELTHLVERVVERVADQIVEHLSECLTAHATAYGERSMERSTPASTDRKAAVLTRLRAMQAEGLSLQAMANRLNAEGISTLSGRGTRQKGTIRKLLAQGK